MILEYVPTRSRDASTKYMYDGFIHNKIETEHDSTQYKT